MTSVSSAGATRVPPVGLWLTRAMMPDVDAWAAKSVVPVLVHRLGLHTALVPRGRSVVGAPYDDATMMCAARPAPVKLSPAMGFWVIDDRAVITVQSKQWRRQIRWVIWDPQVGMMRPPGVDIASPQQILSVARGGRRDELIDMLAERHHPPQRLLSAVVNLLGLPGAEVLLDAGVTESWEGAHAHEPDEREVDFFEDAVKDAVALRRELGWG
ncbi:MAG: hypothetical protein WBA72_06775, partial [Ornithinimicrobium sp.]